MLESKGRLIVVKKDKDKRQFRSTSGHKMDTNNVHNRICYKKHGKKLDGVNMQIKLKN